MIDGCDAALRLNIPQHSIQVQRTGVYAKVYKLRDPEHVEVPVERRHLPSGNQQHVIEVGL